MDQVSTGLLGETKTILIATDGSHYSEGAVREALLLGHACPAKVIVLHVVKIASESLISADSTVRRCREELASYFDQIRSMAKESDVEHEVVIVGSSHPEEAIVEQAYLRKADLIVMGRHGKAGRLSLLVGRMTDRVLNQGFPRVLVVPKECSYLGRKILLAVDGSPGTVKAVEDVACLQHTSQDMPQLTVISVAKKASDVVHVQQIVDSICSQTSAGESKLFCDALVLIGDPSKLIVKTAEEREIDLIIIGGRGKRSLARTFLSQVTKKVTGMAHCSVMVINA